MHIRLIAVGDRQPAWVTDAVETYARRLPKQWKFRLDVIGAARRGADGDAAKARALEGDRVLRKLGASEQLVALEEKGRSWSSVELAGRLQSWQAEGHDLSFVIGGPDGIDQNCLRRASSRWSLSKLTLPHGLARVLVVEQLYRAWTLLNGHPYHRA